MRALVTHFGDPLAVRRADAIDISPVPGFTPRLGYAVWQYLRSPSLAEAEREADRHLAALRDSGARVLHVWHQAYPARLAAIYDAPPFLFVSGSVDACSGHCVAVVGTRRPTPYGLAVAEHFGRELCEAGATVVSGLARGIDTRAHRAAIEAGGKTIAVIGTGIDRCYPHENRRLAADIAASGAVVSEYRPGTGPDPGNFPRRNRIISGLSLGTIVAESDTDGGAMITAHFSLEHDRDVFAVPGSIHSGRSRGCHALIREGKARLAGTAGDVLSDIGHPLQSTSGPAAGSGAPPVSLSGPEESVAGLIGAEPVHIDDLAGRSNLPVPDLLVALLTLEMKNVIRQIPGKYFIRRF